VEFNKRTIIVQGVEIDIDIDESGLAIADLSEDMGRVAAQLAWWASVWAAAEAERMQSDAFYRRWRALQGKALLEKDPKLSDEKRKIHIESDEKFLELKGAMAKAEENVVFAKGMFQAFEKKGNMLQSRGAMARGELAKTGMTTPAETSSTGGTVVEMKAQNGTRKGPRRISTSNGETDDGPAIEKAVLHLRKFNLKHSKALEEAS
jgi:hypothetical protein